MSVVRNRPHFATVRQRAKRVMAPTLSLDKSLAGPPSATNRQVLAVKSRCELDPTSSLPSERLLGGCSGSGGWVNHRFHEFRRWTGSRGLGAVLSAGHASGGTIASAERLPICGNGAKRSGAVEQPRQQWQQRSVPALSATASLRETARCPSRSTVDRGSREPGSGVPSGKGPGDPGDLPASCEDRWPD